MHLLRLSGRKVCERVKMKGRLWKGVHVHARLIVGAPRGKPAGLYVGSVTSAKLHKSAVTRNRMRRRCREALRIAYKGAQDARSVQLLLLPRSSSLNADFDAILRDAHALLSSLPSS
jgi:ribonuclease P protein component